MNDRFKFRVWNPDLKLYDDNPQYNVAIQIEQTEGLILSPFHNNIIEFCTGLKDKNGNLIYEGDKVEISVYGDVINEGFVETDTQYQGIVVWAKQGFYVNVVDEFFYIPEEPEDVEIIGNIHEIKGE